MREGLVSFFAIVFIITPACMGTPRYEPLSKNTYAPRPDEWRIDLYIPDDADCPTKLRTYLNGDRLVVDHPKKGAPPEHEVLGKLEMIGTVDVPWDGFVLRAQKKARELGGDALVLLRAGARDPSHSWTSDVSMIFHVVRYTNQ